MGHRLVSSVFDNWAPLLTNAQARVLLFMAHRALDTKGDRGEPPHLYFAGQAAIARAAGHVEHRSEPTPQALRTVAKVIGQLVEVGALERVQGSRYGSNAVYRIRPDPWDTS